jgi:hypothetical protein
MTIVTAIALNKGYGIKRYHTKIVNVFAYRGWKKWKNATRLLPGEGYRLQVPMLDEGL